MIALLRRPLRLFGPLSQVFAPRGRDMPAPPHRSAYAMDAFSAHMLRDIGLRRCEIRGVAADRDLE
jgi:hypothetical protein